MRELITLACAKCQRRNYHTTRNKKPQTNRLERNKFCRWCRGYTLHKETK